METTIDLLQEEFIELPWSATCETMNGAPLPLREVTVDIYKTPLFKTEMRVLNEYMAPKEDDDLQLQLKIQVGIYSVSSNLLNAKQTKKSKYENEYRGFVRVRDVRHSRLLEGLIKKYGKGLKLKVEISKIELPEPETATETGRFTLKTNGAPISSSTHPPGLYGCKEIDIPVDQGSSANYHQSFNIRHFVDYWNRQLRIFYGYISINVVIPPTVDKSISSNTEKILETEMDPIVTIIAENGVGIKFYKKILFGYSVIFQTMYRRSMQESKTGTVKIADMTEACVRAMVAYLHHRDEQEAIESSSICIELFRAGLNYNISMLKESMKNILLSKGNDWYHVDVALKLFFISRLIPEENELKIKAVQVLKSKYSILETSENFQALFRYDPKIAMELCTTAFSV